ncbi:glutaredoxin-2, mitochondrial [Hydra vulgaris]|uniref:glutaredoxin-2, mitochondrial n=1 Tax=Hydra vulgaris TaxID=6087 RepID=UPI0001925A60|nr:glutaredoxin-2, mitochondrial-like [Hydra vulgaris]
MGNTSSQVSVESIDNKIKNDCVVLFSTTICGYCDKAKELLNTMNIKYKCIELDKMEPPEGGKLTFELMKKTNCRTVPQIFINGSFIGGYTELLDLQRVGLLFEKLSKCSKPCF